MSWLSSASLRKSGADLTRRKGRTLLVVLGIFIGVFGLTVINVTEDALVSSFAYTRGFQLVQPDFQMTVDKLDPALLPTLQAVPNVQTVQFTSNFDACWQLSHTGCSVNLDVVSFPDLQHPPITQLELVAGRYPSIGEILLEQGDQSLHGVQIGDDVTLHVEQLTTRLQVVGFVHTPGANPAESGDALGYMSGAGLQQAVAALGNPVAHRPDGQQIPVYQHHIQIKFQSSSAQTNDETAAALLQLVPSHDVQVLGSGFAPTVSASTLKTIDNIFALLRGLVGLALLLSGLLILNTVTTLIGEQTAIIGTMKALGGTRGAIARGYLTSVGVYSLLATLPGLALGLYAGNQLAGLVAPQIPLELGPFTVAPWVVALSLVVGFGVPLLSALAPLWIGTRISVRDALSAYGVSTNEGNGFLTWLGQRLAWVSQTTWLGLRGVFRKRWRAALSLTTISLTAACFLVVQIAVSSVDGTMGAVRANLSADMTVNFKDNATFSHVLAQLTALPNVAYVERSGGTNADTQWGTVQVSGYEPNTHLYQYELTSGRWFHPDETSVVLVSDAVLRTSGLHIGDTLTLTNNYGSSTQLTLTIIGTVHQTINVLGWIGAAIMPVNTLNELRGIPADSASTATLQAIVAARDRSPDAVNQLAAAISGVVNPSGAASDDPGYYAGNGGIIDTVQEYTSRRQGDAYILYYMFFALALIVGVVGMLGLANSLVASVMERRREIGLLRALGARGWRVAQVFWIESLSLAALSWCAGVVLGLPLAYAFVQTFAARVMPVDFLVNPRAFVVMLGATLIVATLASVAPAWRASRMQIASALRYE
jgi:putative ABC transport system permease protein